MTRRQWKWLRVTLIVGCAAGPFTAWLARADDPPPPQPKPPTTRPAPTSAPTAADATPTPHLSGPVGRLTPAAGMRGWKLFFSKSCIKCHSIWGQGGEIGPDLGRARVGRLSEGHLTAELWNHIPRMWGKMEEEKIPFSSISQQEMEDLFAFLFFLRYMDAPGDPRNGRLALLRHNCQACHQVSGQGGKVGPDLARWSKFTNPVVWSQMMWEAAPEMMRQTRAKGMKWPVFAPGDIVNMIAYIRSVSPSKEKVYLELGSPDKGAELLRTKNCLACHNVRGEGKKTGPDLAAIAIPPNQAEAAVTLWNHAPKMLNRMKAMGLKPVSFSPQEMAHILSYLLSLGYLDRPGDPARGEALFKKQGCVSCHEHGTSSAPALAKMHPEGTTSYITHVMWNKGRVMLKDMTAQGIPWPTFTRDEMLDLLAYLRTKH